MHFLVLLIFYGCKTYTIKDVENINLKLYTLSSSNSSEKIFSIIDTSKVYIQVFNQNSNELERENPAILKFHNDGFFQKKSKKYYHHFEERTKNSIYYGGKYIIIGNNEINIEAFYPSMQGTTKTYKREISSGTVNGDTITLNIFNSKSRYIKTTYKTIFQ